MAASPSERPKPRMDARGRPTHLFNGGVITGGANVLKALLKNVIVALRLVL